LLVPFCLIARAALSTQNRHLAAATCQNLPAAKRNGPKTLLFSAYSHHDICIMMVKKHFFGISFLFSDI